MPKKRIPLAFSISTRDGTLTKDAQLYNCHPVKQADGKVITERRFGYTSKYVNTAGTGLGLYYFNGHLVSVIGTSLYQDGVSVGTVDGTSRYWFTTSNYAGTTLFLKNNSAAYTWDGVTLTKITDANYPATTTAGVAYLDGYIIVQDTSGKLWNCNLSAPTTWNALNFIQGSLSPDGGVYVGRYLNFVISMANTSITLFYDAGNTPPGSPLLPQMNNVINVGCASGGSVVEADNTVFFVGQTKQKGRSVYYMNGGNAQIISTPFIDRILNNDSLSGVYAYGISILGHSFYVLTLTASNVTLVYDLTTQLWVRWTSTTAGTTSTAVSASYTMPTVYVYAPAHGLVNGQLVNITGSGTSVSALGTFVVSVTDANNFTYSIAQSGYLSGIDENEINSFAINDDSVLTGNVTPTIGTISFTPWVNNYFSPLFYANGGGLDYLLDKSNGVTYQMNTGIADDFGKFIYMRVDTDGLDFGENNYKFYDVVSIIGDKIGDSAYLMYSDDDFTTYGVPRLMLLSANRVQKRRCGRARRRSWTIFYYGAYQARFYELEFDLEIGTM